MKPTLAVLAAGMGSRYGGLKQIDGVGPSGEAIIDYSIYDALDAGFGKVVFIIRKDIEAPFRKMMEGKFDHRIKVEYVFQELDSKLPPGFSLDDRQKPWGTGHATLVLEDAIDEPFAVINADDYYGREAFHTMAAFLKKDCKPNHYAMVGYQLSKTLSENGTVSRGVCSVDPNGYLHSIHERTKIKAYGDKIMYEEDEALFEVPWNSSVSMNFWGFHPSIFPHLHQSFKHFLSSEKLTPKSEYFIPIIVQELILSGKMKLSVLPCDDKWYGITYREDKPEVVELFHHLTDTGFYPKKLW